MGHICVDFTDRMTWQTEERDHLNLQIDLLAEQEMTLLLRMLRQITDKFSIPPPPKMTDELRN